MHLSCALKSPRLSIAAVPFLFNLKTNGFVCGGMTCTQMKVMLTTDMTKYDGKTGSASESGTAAAPTQ
jgi:hypothetical protein